MADHISPSHSVLHGALGPIEHRIDTLVSGIKTRLAERREFNRIERELSSFSDRGLADLGISRHDIDRIAREGSRMKARR